MKMVATTSTVHEYNVLTAYQTRHPLVSVLDFSQSERRQHRTGCDFGFYSVFLKEDKHCDGRYGRQTYDCQESALLFGAVEQAVSQFSQSDVNVENRGHPGVS